MPNIITRYLNSKMRYNVLFSVMMLLIFVAAEEIFRLNNPSLSSNLDAKEILGLLLIFVIISFINSRRTSYLFLCFLLLVMLFQKIHFNYYGAWIFPFEIYLFFTKFREVSETFSSVYSIAFFPIIVTMVMIILIPIIFKYTKDRIASKKVDIFFVFLLVLLVVRVSFGAELGARPEDNRSILKNSIYTVAYFIGKTFPYTLLNISSVEKYSHDVYGLLPDNMQSKAKTVVFIIGESLASNHMSLYGYNRKTTPYLDDLVGQAGFVNKKAIASGVYTDTSLPMLFNISKRPDANEHILSRRTNLFRQAKSNGFKTFFISSHANAGLSYIRSYLSMNDIDVFKDSIDHGLSKYDSAIDSILISQLNKISYSKKNFIVFSMIGSHSPYNLRVPDQFDKFGDQSFIDQYDNTVAYTDKILSGIISIIQEKVNGDVIFLFTSDHGESVSKSGYGHGNIRKEAHYRVPFFIYSPKKPIFPKVNRILSKIGDISHFDISKIVSFYLGYDTLQDDSDNIVYVIGRALNGNSGYVELHYEKGIIINKIVHD